MKCYKGSISIYFVFSILLIISIIFSVTELARYNCQKLYLQIATDAGLDSMVSLYHRKLYEYYNVYGVEYRDDELLTKEYLGYVKPHFVEEGSGKKIANWYNASISENSIDLTYKKLIDDSFFEREIIEYMKYAIIGKTFDFFGKEIGIEKTEDAKLLLDGAKDVFNEVKESDVYSEIYERYFDFKSEIKSFESSVKNVSSKITDINQKIQSLGEFSTSGTSNNVKSVKNKINTIKTNFSTLKTSLNTLKSDMTTLRRVILEKKEEYIADKASGIYDFGDDVINFIESEFAEFLSHVIPGGAIDIEIERKNDEINEVSRIFDNIISDIMSYYDDLSEIEEEIKTAKKEKGDDYDADYIKDLNEEKRDLEKEISDYFKDVKDEIKNIRLSDIEVDITTTSHDNEENILKRLIDYKNSLLLNLIFPSDVLEQIDNSNIHYNLYSIFSDNQTISVEKILLGEYALDKFNYLNKEMNGETTDSGSSNFEVERLISGKNSNLDSIKNVVNKIFVIRLAMNVLYIYKNSEMRATARSFAYSIFGGFSMLLAETMFLIMITAWGTAQSIYDLKRIVKNCKVNFIHDESSWKVSIDSILQIALNGIESVSEEDDNALAISYKDYLRMLLLLEKQSLINERMASIMEHNISCTQDTFSFEKLISAFATKNEFLCTHYFTNFLFIKAKDVVLKNEYKITASGYKSFIK